MYYDSEEDLEFYKYNPNWDYNLGVCLVHFLPSVPCPACQYERDNKTEVCEE